jgi:ABC-type phosphate transport system substrate-binding protein
VKWPVGIGAPGNAGVSSAVQKTEGAIGYVEVAYALGGGFTLPYVQNAAGNFVQPLLENVSAAAASAVPSSDIQGLATSITNGSDAKAYPIAAFTYILVRQSTYTDVNKAQALSDYLYWSLTEGQGAANRHIARKRLGVVSAYGEIIEGESGDVLGRRTIKLDGAACHYMATSRWGERAADARGAAKGFSTTAGA